MMDPVSTQASAKEAAALLHTTLVGWSAEANTPMADVVDRVNRAAAQLDAAAAYAGPALGAAVQMSTQLLNDAVNIARTQQCESSSSLVAVEQSIGMLNPSYEPQFLPDRDTHPAPPLGHAPPTEIEADDRRACARHSFEVEVGFESDSNFYTGFTEDISEGGLFLATYQLKPRGTEIDVLFTLPDGHEVKTVGIVRWLRDLRDDNPDARPGMGIQFVSVDEEDREAIQIFLGIRSPLFYDD